VIFFPAAMKALVLNRPGGGLALQDVDLPDRPDECRVQVRMAGICGTDLELIRGYADFAGVPGHEFTGVVVEAPPHARSWMGRRVVGEINVGCGDCRFCRLGVKEHCERRSVLGIRDRSGAFAEYVSLPPDNLREIPEDLEDERAVFVEPTAAACRILEQTEVGPSTRAAVVGDGRMGLLTAQVLRAAGAAVTVVGRHPEKLAVAAALDLPALPDADADPLARAFDLVIDVSGRAAGLSLALRLTRPRGVVVLKSTFHGELAWTPWPAIVDEITLVGSRCGPFAPAISRIRSAEVNVRPLISRVVPLDDWPAAFEAAARELKVLFHVGG